jgi:hypothetical protein
MTSSLLPYPFYKDSGVQWLEEIRASIVTLETETDGRLTEPIGSAGQ